MNVSWRHTIAGAGMAILVATALSAIGEVECVDCTREASVAPPHGEAISFAGGSSSGVASAAGAAFYKAAIAQSETKAAD